MKKYYSNEETWFDPTDEIKDLDFKDVLLIEGKQESPALLSIVEAPKKSANSGQLAVRMRQVDVVALDWDKDDKRQSLKLANWQAFLTQVGLSSLRPVASPRYAEDFELRIS